jgi:alpha-L-arabinofuranosidase B-like protein
MQAFRVQVCLFVASCVALLPPAGAQDGREHSIRAYAPARHYIRHANSLGWISPINVELDSLDARFKTVRGLAKGDCVSFKSTNIRDHYLRHANSRIILSPYSDDSLFKKDATFCMEWGLKRMGNEPSVTFRSFNYPERVIRHRNFELWLDPVENSPLFRSDASFFIEPVRGPPTRIDYDAGQPADE